ncbi:uncharacterized protein LOC117116766 [Anneissia japonica]|uniref:uncharacterized protein LOC117116766 n=1 Tax=Anneissia japonica TaxID=1529436 RepID=UPI001425AADB|nr:uncharacterized protein LOC117116766 [Anneissia japonica]
MNPISVIFILLMSVQLSGAQFLDALLTGMSWTLKETRVRPDTLTDMQFQVVVNASSESSEVRGTGLWEVVVFGSTHIKGRGKRFDPRGNLLTPSQQATPTIPGGSMVFKNVVTPFRLSNLGCSKYKYLCVEFKQGDAPDPDFFFASMDFEDTIIVCTNIPCQEGTGQKDVMLIAMSWIVDAYVRQGIPSDVTIRSSIQMSPNHGGAEGTDLWRMGLFINSQEDGKGDSLPQRQDQILNRTEASKNVRPGQKLNITGTASIDLTGVGCGKYRYLCIEFGKGRDPQPNDFGFTLGSGESSVISCRELSCQDDTSRSTEGARDGTVSDGTLNDNGRGTNGTYNRGGGGSGVVRKKGTDMGGGRCDGGRGDKGGSEKSERIGVFGGVGNGGDGGGDRLGYGGNGGGGGNNGGGRNGGCGVNGGRGGGRNNGGGANGGGGVNGGGGGGGGGNRRGGWVGYGGGLYSGGRYDVGREYSRRNEGGSGGGRRGGGGGRNGRGSGGNKGGVGGNGGGGIKGGGGGGEGGGGGGESAYLRKELRLNGVKEYYWTDSKVVICYLKNETKRFKIYVSNRVQFIRDLTKMDQWKYVRSEHNPSDEGSRGMTAAQLVTNPRWLNGPKFLWNSKFEPSKVADANYDDIEDIQ